MIIKKPLNSHLETFSLFTKAKSIVNNIEYSINHIKFFHSKVLPSNQHSKNPIAAIIKNTAKFRTIESLIEFKICFIDLK